MAAVICGEGGGELQKALLVREDADDPRAAADLLVFPFRRVPRAQAAPCFRLQQRVQGKRFSPRLLETLRDCRQRGPQLSTHLQAVSPGFGARRSGPDVADAAQYVCQASAWSRG